MKKFIKIISTALPIRTENVDTDQIIPARFLKTTKREGLGQYLFYNWRFDEGGNPKSKCFDNSNYQSKKILIAGNNFGCGSSREHAVWALLDFGFRALISSSFGDIFYNNSLKNGLLPVVVTHQKIDALNEIVENNPETLITIELEKQILVVKREKHLGVEASRIDSMTIFFPIDSFRKTCLLKGVDEMGYVLSHDKQIMEFEQKHRIFISA